MYFETRPFGCKGGSHETNIESDVSANALMPAGGPGTTYGKQIYLFQYCEIKKKNCDNIIYSTLTIFFGRAVNRIAQNAISSPGVCQYANRIIRVFVQRVQIRLVADGLFYFARSGDFHCKNKFRLFFFLFLFVAVTAPHKVYDQFGLQGRKKRVRERTVIGWYWPIKNFVALNNSAVLMSGRSFPVYFHALGCKRGAGDPRRWRAWN